MLQKRLAAPLSHPKQNQITKESDARQFRRPGERSPCAGGGGRGAEDVSSGAAPWEEARVARRGGPSRTR